jgi:hypothetical protein
VHGAYLCNTGWPKATVYTQWHVHHASDVYRSCISTLTDYAANTLRCSARVELTNGLMNFDFGEVDAEIVISLLDPIHFGLQQ